MFLMKLYLILQCNLKLNIMKLELKHLAPYLPYELRIFHSAFMFRNTCNENEIGTMVGITDVVELDVLGETTFDIVIRRDKYFYKLHDSRGHFKPILRPLSDLTKEIEHNGEKFVPSSKFENLYLNDCKWGSNSIGTGIIGKNGFMAHLCFMHNEIIGECPLAIYELLIEWHFDVFGLIEKGLAVDINTLKK